MVWDVVITIHVTGVQASLRIRTSEQSVLSLKELIPCFALHDLAYDRRESNRHKLSRYSGGPICPWLALSSVGIWNNQAPVSLTTIVTSHDGHCEVPLSKLSATVPISEERLKKPIFSPVSLGITPL
jgi:hypothetical protein